MILYYKSAITLTTTLNKTIMAKKINVVYFDNFDFDFDEYKEWFMENCDIEDEDDVSDDDVYEYINDCLRNDFDDFFANLEYSKNNDKYCVITGRLGLWNGRPQIEPCVCEDVESAIKKCIDKCDYCIIKQVNGHLEVIGIHHDGRNTFEINLLNDKGVDAYYRIREGWGRANLADRHYHKSLGDYLF